MTSGKEAGAVACAFLVAGGLAFAGPPAQAVSARPALALCATRPYPTTSKPVKPILTGPDVWRFVSAPGLRPMRVTVIVRRRGTARGRIFTAPYTTGRMVGQTGSLILGDSGEPVWFRPLPSPRLENADFQVQSYRDPRTGVREPVLTWWQGTLAIPPAYTNVPSGAPEPGSCYYIDDSRYRLVRTVKARNGFTADEHEFTLTRSGDALFIASRPVPLDLEPFGGPRKGAIEDSEVQEINLATGRLVFTWDMLSHVDPADSKTPASTATSSGGVWDAFHMNSAELGPGGQLLISARNMWAIYDVSMRTGKILWQLGGTRSDFTFGRGASFFWQHDARFRPGNKISMFDDGCCALPDGKPEQESHGLILRLSFRARHATAVRTFFHQPVLFSATQGNLQRLGNGNEFVGWGQNPYYSEYESAGNTARDPRMSLLYDAKMPGSNLSYRTFRQRWTGRPYYRPNIAVRGRGREVTIYASWNGSTLTRAWRVLGGTEPGHLRVIVRRVRSTGFETAVRLPVPDRLLFFQVEALSATGRVLRASRVA
jgi:hypothetical protein